jgi:predicted HD phosphohydrolase
MEPARSVAELLVALRQLAGFSDSVIGEAPVDLLSHSLQCAALLADDGADDELLVAALFHDIGHRVAPGHQRDHGRNGATFVRGVLGDRVARLIELHVPAKAYLVATDPLYATALSAGSAASLEVQGGAMDDAAAGLFAADPLADAAIRLRRADEAAKVPDAEVGTVEQWESVVSSVAATAG